MTRLLVVEDSPDIQWIVRRLARRAGQELLCCEDVESAWEVLQDQRPDLTLVDLNLPGARGEVLCRRIRADERRADLRLALFTHWDRPEDVASGLEAGAEYVVSKDLLADPDTWLWRLQECLSDCGDNARSLQWAETGRLPIPQRAAGALDRVLRHVLMRPLGVEVLRVVIRRALDRVQAPHDWLTPDLLGLDEVQVAQTGHPSLLTAFARDLSEQTWRLLGQTAAAQPCAALASALHAGEDDSSS